MPNEHDTSKERNQSEAWREVVGNLEAIVAFYRKPENVAFLPQVQLSLAKHLIDYPIDWVKAPYRTRMYRLIFKIVQLAHRLTLPQQLIASTSPCGLHEDKACEFGILSPGAFQVMPGINGRPDLPAVITQAFLFPPKYLPIDKDQVIYQATRKTSSFRARMNSVGIVDALCY